jgi:hypothetical protein
LQRNFGFGNSLLRRQVQPFVRCHDILRHPCAVLITKRAVVLSSGVALLSGLAVPIDRLRVVLRDTRAVRVANGEIELPRGILLLGAPRSASP